MPRVDDIVEHAARLPNERKLGRDRPALADGGPEPQTRAPCLAVEREDLVAPSRKPAMVRELRRHAAAQALVGRRRFPRGDTEDRYERAQVPGAERRGLLGPARDGDRGQREEENRRSKRPTSRRVSAHRTRLSTIMIS